MNWPPSLLRPATQVSFILTWCISHLSEKVTELLVEACKTAPLKILSLQNSLDQQGFKFLMATIRNSASLESLDLRENSFTEDNANSIVEAVIGHSKLDDLLVRDQCCAIRPNVVSLECKSFQLKCWDKRTQHSHVLAKGTLSY